MTKVLKFPGSDDFERVGNFLPVVDGTALPARPEVKVPAPLRIVESELCPICKGAGWLRVDVQVGDPRFGKPVKCRCREQATARAATAKTYTWLGLAEDDLGQKTFETFTRRNEVWQQRAFDLASGYASMVIAQTAGQENLCFKGSVGTGKTHLAAAILNRARAAGIPCLFATAPEFFTALYAAEFDAKEALINEAATTPLFCLDDIDKLHVKPSNDPEIPSGSYQKGVLFDVLNRRYRARRPTILTTNAQAGLDRWLDEATQDRLLGDALHVEMIGASQRRTRG